jgi:UDP-glucose 4-epimerase
MKNVLVTGGAGFIGSTLVEALRKRSDCERVVVVDSLTTGHQKNLSDVPNVEFRECDVRDYDGLSEAFKDIDVVFHQAAIPSVPRSIDEPDFCFGINVTGTFNVIRAAVENKVRRIVFASSSAIYGDSPALPKVETMLPEPKSPYGAHKLAGEHFLKTAQESYGIETVALRYFNVFGPRQDPSSTYSGVLSIFAQRSLSRDPPTIYGDGEQSRDFIYVDDVVRLNLLAAEAPGAAGQVFNGGCGEGISLNRAWYAMQAAAGSELAAIHGPDRPGDVRHSRADISSARQILGFKPSVAFEDGVRRTLNWYATQQKTE